MLVSAVTIVVFAGPSVSPEDCRAILPEVVALPPARAGDIGLTVRSNPRAIGICDVASVESFVGMKAEVMAALGAGMPVYGAAAVGAMWAAELEALGMIGVGFVFEQYKRGALQHVGEILLAHGSGSSGYSPSSESLVNIWATLDQATLDGVISAASCDSFRRLARELPVPLRTYTNLIQRASTRGFDALPVAALERYLRSHLPVNHQRRDALMMLTKMRDDVQGSEEHTPSSPRPRSARG